MTGCWSPLNRVRRGRKTLSAARGYTTRRRAERGLLQQVGNLRRPLPEAFHKLHAHLVDVLLLRGGADDLGTRRERDFAGRVLGMKMRVDN